MTWSAPLALGAAAAAALVVTLLHFFNRDTPPRYAFPTARFVGSRNALAPAASRRPTDLLLLLLRIAAIVAMGAAFAGPTWTPGGGTRHRIVLVDQSRLVADAAGSLAATRSQASRSDIVVPFDSGRRAGSLTSALVLGIRLAQESRGEVDLVLVSPMLSSEWDAATLAVRAQWPGPIAVVRVPTAPDTTPRAITLSSVRDDVIRATLGLAGISIADASGVRLVRNRPTAIDTAFMNGGGTLVVWPTDPRSLGWNTADSTDGVVAGTDLVLGRAPRSTPPTGTVVARWIDGAAAVTEHTSERGCERDIALTLPPAGDLALRHSMQRFARTMVQPCNSIASSAPLNAARIDLLTRPPTKPKMRMTGRGPRDGHIAALCLALAATFLLLEVVVRRTRAYA